MDRAQRVRVLAIAILLVVVVLAIQGFTADPTTSSGVTHTNESAYPGDTLITVQSYGSFQNSNGGAFIVDQNGSVVWRYQPANSRVFDGEYLESGTLLLSVATEVPAEDCPPEYQNTARYGNHCVKNRVFEIDIDTKEITWEYAWFDAFIHWHEVHDADRLSSGETAIIDMGSDRVFTVSREGEITWEWDGRTALGPESEFWANHVPEDAQAEYRPKGPESDWTHMNDIDLLESGEFQLSIRNFDVVIEVDPSTNRIQTVIGEPGAHDLMKEQHDPNRLADEALLIADSENNRVVEYDLTTGEQIWKYTGEKPTRLQWPRDADRLPNGNTLIADSRNLRVIEINPAGNVVWEYSLREEVGILYDADRLGLPEEPDDVPTGHALDEQSGGSAVSGFVSFVESWAGLVFPAWMRFPELVLTGIGLVLSLWLMVETGLYLRNERE